MNALRVLGAHHAALGAAVAVGALGGAGSLFVAEQLTAQVVNKEQTVTLGTLILSDQVGDGAACLSAPDLTTDLNEQRCESAFDLKIVKPGDAATVNVQISNVGVLDGSALRVYVPSCVDGNAESFHGSGSVCASLQIYIQRWTDRTRSVAAACVYGASPDGRNCDFSDQTKTFGSFSSAHGSTASAVVIGPLPSGATAYFTIGVRLPRDADNALQGRKATASIAWHVSQ